LKNHKFSVELSKKKAENINQTQADYVITTCPACVIGLRQGLALTGGKAKVVSLLEFLSKADNISL
jgi:glycolate oxidase iron-sulfur subunit